MCILNMPRRIHNVKNRVRAEEDSIDNALKAAGLWEDGLSLIEKRQYYQLISDSKCLAEEEETRRQVIYTGSVSGPTSKKEEYKTNTPADDSDPEITFESSFSASQSNCATPSSKVTETATISGSNDLSSQKKDESKLLNNSSLQGNKHIRSLLSNSSITVRYTPETSRNSSGVKENIIVSETDDENEEDSIPNDKGSLAQKHNIEKVSNSGKENSGVPVVDIKESNEGKGCNISNGDDSNNSNNSNLLKLKAVLEADKKKSFKEVSNPESGIIVNRLNSIAIGAAIGKSIQPDRPYESDLNMPSTSTSTSSLSLKKNGTKMTGPFVFVPNSINVDSQPLNVKRNLLSEKPNRAYFKADFETETNCMKRIYSLIADWQSKIAEYQRSLLGSCKFGLPIGVDRQLTNSIVKNSFKIRSQITNKFTFQESDDSSASDRVSNKSSDDELFPKRKKSKSYRKHYSRRCNTTKQAKTSYMENDTEMDYFAAQLSSDDVLPDLEVKCINDNINNEPNSPVASTSKINGNEAFINDHQEMSSQDPVMPVNKFYKNSKNSVRKTFQLSPDASPSAVIEEFSSPDLESQSAAEEGNKINTEQQEQTSPNIEECNENSKSSQVANQWITKQSSNKRRHISGSLGIPSSKINAEQEKQDSPDIEACNETPKSSKVTGQWISSNNKRRRTSISPSTLSLKMATSNLDSVANTASSDITSLQNPNQSRENKTDKKVLDLPDESDSDHESAASTGDIIYTLPREKKRPSQMEIENTEVVESEEARPIEIERHEVVVEEEKEEISIRTVDCPLCQLHFPLEEIEAHASECNGPVEEEVQVPPEMPSTSTRSAGRSRPKLVNDQPMDVTYLETRKF